MLKLFRLLAPFRASILLALVLALAQSLANLYLPRLMADIVDDGIIKSDTSAIWSIGGVMLLVAVVGMGCTIASSYLAARIASGFGRIVRGRIFDRVTHLSVHQFDRFGSASLITRTTNDTTQIQQVLVMLLMMVITAPMMAIGGVALAVSQDATLAWVLAAVIPVVMAVFVLIMRGAVPLFQQMQTRIDRLNLILEEGLTGVRVIRAFDRGAHEHARFDAANRDVTDTAIRANRLVALLMPSMMLALNLTSIAIIWFGGQRIGAGTMDVGVMIASLQYAMQILFAVFMVAAMFVMLPRAAASAVRINEVLDVLPDVTDPAVPAPAPPRRGEVAFRNVSFQYPGAEEPALAGVSFTARPGEVTAIIGGTGSGKSTLAGLIPRLFDAVAGQVCVDGVDVRHLTQADLRSRIGFVPQKAVLFAGTLADNLRYGREDASADDLRAATMVAQATDFVNAMPAGLESPAAQGGTNLSGGQRQRIAIARALVRRPDIFVFDDSFSALDAGTEARLRSALARHTSSATVFVVSQRIGSVMHADRIIVLDDGRVAGIGTHQELLDTSEVYREIVASQLSAEEVA